MGVLPNQVTFTIKPRAMLAVVLLSPVGVLMGAWIWSWPWESENAAAWVQAVGSIGAIIAASLIATRQRREQLMDLHRKEQVVIKAVSELAEQAFLSVYALEIQLESVVEPIDESSPLAARIAVQSVEESLRELKAIDLMVLPRPDMVEAVIGLQGALMFSLEECKKCRPPGGEDESLRASTDVSEYYVEVIKGQKTL